VRTYVIGDIHGAYKAMIQCFERANFDHKYDRLIVLGDVCDGYPEVKQCIDELLKIKNCDLVIGNHDMWALDWALHGNKPEIWTSQGGDKTIRSYNGGPMPQAHVDFLKKGHLWLKAEGRLFIHAGFDPDRALEKQDPRDLVWDRELFKKAWNKDLNEWKEKLRDYKNIFIGHTPTGLYRSLLPIKAGNIWNLDTGAGWSGKLTIMNGETKEYWQSDFSSDLYGGTPDKL